MLILQNDAWNWIDWGSNLGTLNTGSANTIFNALYISVLEAAINTANLLGQAADATYYQGLLARVKAKCNTSFWNSASRAYVFSNQSSTIDDRSNAWALLAGVTDDAQKAG